MTTDKQLVKRTVIVPWKGSGCGCFCYLLSGDWSPPCVIPEPWAHSTQPVHQSWSPINIVAHQTLLLFMAHKALLLFIAHKALLLFLPERLQQMVRCGWCQDLASRQLKKFFFFGKRIPTVGKSSLCYLGFPAELQLFFFTIDRLWGGWHLHS